jgi:CheY-like chemotaxis protein
VTAPDGRRAVEALEREPVDLVLMDMQMPEMNGFEATAAIRSRERTTGTRVPIVALTAHAMTGDRERCLAAGMDAYVSKPIEPRELFAAIDRVVPAAPEAPAVAADPERALELTRRLRTESRRILEDLRRGLVGRDLRALERAAHRFTDSLASVTAAAAVGAGRRLQAFGHAAWRERA